MAGTDHRPGAARTPRVRRIRALHEARIDFYATQVLPGGCFFATTEFEFNARPGAVRDRLVEVFAGWAGFLERLVEQAIEIGELPAHTDPALLAYEIDSFGIAAAMRSRMLDPDSTYRLARHGVLHRLRALCPDPNLLPEGPS